MKNKNITYEKYGILGFIFIGITGVALVIISVTETQATNKLPAALTEAFNLVVLFAFGIIIKIRKLNFSGDNEIKILAESLHIADKDFKTAKFNIDRVNLLIAQLVDKVFWFIVFLMLFYVLYLFEDLNSKAFISQLNRPFPFIKFFENIFNVISGAFIYFGFKVLYDRMLDEDNKPRSYYKGTFIFLLSFIVSYTVLLLAYFNDEPHQTRISNYYNLACGIYNGCAMGLLFGRLISMEYYFKEIQLTSYKFSKQFYHYGAIYILPLYITANTLYGVQEFIQFDVGNLQTVKASMFSICFIGKGFFFLFIYHYINYKWLHIYLHLIIANSAIPREIINFLSKRGKD